MNHFSTSWIKLVLVCFGLLATASVHAADLFYIKGTSLYVIHDVDQGKTESRLLDTSVASYQADTGAVIYVKGSTLWLIRDTREPKPFSLESGVGELKMKDGLIAYFKGDTLSVRRVSEDATVASRSIENSMGVSSMDVSDGTIVFIKNVTTLYRVTDIERGTSERVVYPVGSVQISGK
jgi:hypothetical protein